MDEPVQGMRELMAGFDALPALLQRKVMTQVMRAGGRPIVRRARGKVHNVSGRLARSIRVTVVRRAGQVIARIVAGRNLKKDDPYYAVMVELGTKPHEIRPAGKKSLFLAGLFAEVVQHPGAKAEPFLLPALEEGADEALAAMQEELGAQIEALGGLAG